METKFKLFESSINYNTRKFLVRDRHTEFVVFFITDFKSYKKYKFGKKYAYEYVSYKIEKEKHTPENWAIGAFRLDEGGLNDMTSELMTAKEMGEKDEKFLLKLYDVVSRSVAIDKHYNSDNSSDRGDAALFELRQAEVIKRQLEVDKFNL